MNGLPIGKATKSVRHIRWSLVRNRTGECKTPQILHKLTLGLVCAAMYRVCDASTPPMNGKRGNCTTSIANGSICHPICDEGYHLSDATNCSEGQLDTATCVLSPIWSNVTSSGTIISPPYSPWCRFSIIATDRYMYVFGELARFLRQIPRQTFSLVTTTPAM
jgi:hypothetical protein